MNQEPVPEWTGTYYTELSAPREVCIVQLCRWIYGSEPAVAETLVERT
jgi:hypothetical protein